MGSVHYAAKNLGFIIVGSCDNNILCQATYRKNWSQMPQKDIFLFDSSKYLNTNVIFAGFPC